MQKAFGATPTDLFQKHQGINTWSYFVGQVCGKVKLLLLINAMPPILFYVCGFVRPGEGRSAGPEGQNCAHYKPHLVSVH